MNRYHKIAFIFPGQGAQFPGMGKDFANEFQEARLAFEEADDILKYNLSKIVFDGPESNIKETKNSQLGIFVNSIAILRVINKLFPQIKPQVCSGLSLGEYTALAASERVSFEKCLELVQHRGQYMNDACEATQGTMSVIIGLEPSAVEDLVNSLKIPHALWIANYNCPGQIVISGTPQAIELASNSAKEKGARQVIPLQVHGAFHSGLMQSAETRLEKHVQTTTIAASPIKFVMNVPGDFVEDINSIQKNLIKQVTSPVRWEQGVRAMNQWGVDLFIEIGCGTTLSGMNKRIGVNAPTINIQKSAQLVSLEKVFSTV